jgi:hypothetical protein
MNDAAFLFSVIRRCAPGECEDDCNCALITVDVDVDELTAVEVAHFTARGTAAQRAELAAYFAPDAPALARCSAPPPALVKAA